MARLNKAAACVAAALLCAPALPALAADEPAPPGLAAGVAPYAAGTGWTLRLPKPEKVIYRGIASFDEAGSGAGGMLYPAPNAVGFLAAVLTHSLLVGSAKDQQKTKLQQEADKVLEPYQPVLGEYLQKDLMQRGLQLVAAGGNRRLVDADAAPAADWLIDSTPVFSLTRDQSTIVLENVIAVYAPSLPSAPAYQNVIRVVSKPRTESDLVAFWTANQGEKLKDESAGLLAQSLDIALGEVSAAPGQQAVPQKTYRYQEGSAEKMERGQLVSERCGRTVIRTLRGWLMSIPSKRPAEESCGQQAAQGGASPAVTAPAAATGS